MVISIFRWENLLPRVFKVSATVVAISLAASLSAGCSHPAETAEIVRPVKAVRVADSEGNQVAELSGEVRARIESRLGFRVGGKIIARKVDVGSPVKRGQALLQLDPQDLQLARTQADAGLMAAESNRDLARADYKRYQDLKEKNFVSPAVLDAKETAYKAAQASYEQALAAYRNQSNQAAYATLTSDVDGVVTAVEAEAGQVVAAGAPVVRVARLDEKEVAVGIPEGKVDSLRRADDIRVRLWADPTHALAGRIREISPIADPATRTYAARIAIPATPAAELGMTASVSFSAKAASPAIRLPLSALFEHKGNSAVWVVQDGAARLRPVRIAGAADNDVLVAQGLTPGDLVVTAGANRLAAGQKVRVLGDDLPATAARASAPGAMQ